MSYTPIIRPRTILPPQPALSGAGSTTLSPVFVVLGVGAVVGLGYLIYQRSKSEREIRKHIAEKDGAAGLARYEDAKTKRAAVQGGLGILSGLAWGGGNHMRRNGRRRSSRRLRRNHNMTFGQWYKAAGSPKVEGSQMEYAVMRLRDDWAAGVDPHKYRSLTRNKRRRSRRRTSRR